jgi:signal transduction histidine kinase
LNDTLETEKIAVGKFALRMQPTSLRDTLQAVLRTIQPVARSSGIQIEMDLAPNIPASVLADAPRIMQVLGNFASNAIKACRPDSGGHVRISVTCSDAPIRTPQFVSPRASYARAAPTMAEENLTPVSAAKSSATDFGTGKVAPYKRPRARAIPSSTPLGEPAVVDSASHTALAWLRWLPQWFAGESSDDDDVTSVSVRSSPKVQPPAPSLGPAAGTTTPLEDPGASLPTTPNMSIITPNAEELAASAVGPMWFQFRVSDNGSGLSDEQLRSLWSPFMQIDTQRPTAGSSGLGLYICKAIVMCHGGHVFADSEVGTGSTFGAELPLQVLVAAPPPVAVQDSKVCDPIPAAAVEVVAPAKVNWRAIFPEPLSFLLVDDGKSCFIPFLTWLLYIVRA